MSHAEPQARSVTLNRVDQPIAKATGLPNECYTTRQSFEADRDQVMGRNWACIAFLDQLPEKNFGLPIDFMGLPLVVTRDAQDQVRVFHNVCSHRGMLLADKPCRNNGTLRCPYHNWTYRLDGSLHGTPHIGGYGKHEHQEFDPANAGLKPVRSACWLGAVFVNLSGDAVPFEDYISPVTNRWNTQFAPENEWSAVQTSEESSMKLCVDSNWKLAVENYLESYHLPSVHPELNRVSPLSEHYHIDYFENGCGQGSQNYQRREYEGNTLPSLTSWPTEISNRSEYPVLYPNTLLGIHTDQLFIMYLEPNTENRTTEHVRLFYFGDGATNESYRTLRSENLEGWSNVFKEDIFAVERMQQGRHSPAYGGGKFSPVMDEPTHHFHKWVARQLAH